MSQLTMKGPPQLWTTGRIAEDADTSRERVDYVARTRGIDPSAYAGSTRLFDREAVALIKYHLRKLNERRGANK